MGRGWEVPLGVQLEFLTLFLVLENLAGMLQDWGPLQGYNRLPSFT